MQCDLGSLASVRKAAGEIIAKDYTIDYFIASAAIVSHLPPPPPFFPGVEQS